MAAVALDNANDEGVVHETRLPQHLHILPHSLHDVPAVLREEVEDDLSGLGFALLVADAGRGEHTVAEALGDQPVEHEPSLVDLGDGLAVLKEQEEGERNRTRGGEGGARRCKQRQGRARVKA
eukprot:759031-Hanusia_phi.AAC.1